MIKNLIKRNIAFLLAITTIFSYSAQVVYASSEPTLEMPEYFMVPDSDIGSLMPFKPAHKYSSTQNPPDFTWPRIEGAEKYDLIIAKDEGLRNIVYSKYGLSNHYYNFPYTFEPGNYYWAVRYYIGDEVSPWSAARRFRLDIDNVEFTVPEGSAIIDAFPEEHPKIWFTKDTLDEFRKKAETTQGKCALEKLVSAAEVNIKTAIPKDPGKEFIDGKPSGTSMTANGARNAAVTIGSMAQTNAMAYILTGEKKYLDFAIECAMEVSSWDYSEGCWTAFTGNDLAYFQIVLDFSFVYDWLYNDMTQEQRKTLGDMLHGRFFAPSGYRVNGEILPVADHMINILQDKPYTSHLWSHLGDYIFCSMALFGEYSDVKEYLIRYVEFYLSNYAPMCYEDGSWSKGTGYFRTAYARESAVPKALYVSEILDMFKKPFHRNQYLFPLYMLPVKSYGSFGDEAGKSLAYNRFVSQGSSEDTVFTNNPIPRWQLHVAGSYDDFLEEFDAILSVESAGVEPKVPTDHPRAWHFPDTGMTAMHSDLVSTDKISLYFRSGRFGSFEHMQCDQNAFVIEANGERLASESGWYDSYHSNHDSGFTRKTYATNSVTYDHGSGQYDDDFDADGTTKMFVNQAEFDAVVGDATNAYKGQIGNFTRSIIYIRPDVYIVVDDLDAGEKETSFEWWMNTVAENDISVHEDNKGITIEAENMALYTRMYAPDKITPYYSDVYSGPDLVNVPTLERYAEETPDKRVWFETEKVNNTKFISSMSVHKIGDAPKNITETDFGDYLRLEFEGGTVAIINKTADNKNLIDAGDVVFNGTAAVYSEDSVMLVGGNELSLYGIKLIESEKTVTAVVGKEEISIGCEDDNKVTIYSGNEIIPEIKDIKQRLKDSLRTPISPELTGFGVEYIGEGKIEIDAVKGNYIMHYNDKELPGQKLDQELEFEIVVNGKSYKRSVPAYLNHDGELAGYGDIDVPEGDYVLIDKTDGIAVGKRNFSKTEAHHVEETQYISVTGENQRIEFVDISAVVKANSVSTITENGKITAIANVNNSKGDDEANVVLIIAQYLDGFFEDAKIGEVTVAKGGTGTVSAVADEVNGAEIKCYLWEKQTLKSLIDVTNVRKHAVDGADSDTEFVEIKQGKYDLIFRAKVAETALGGDGYLYKNLHAFNVNGTVIEANSGSVPFSNYVGTANNAYWLITKINDEDAIGADYFGIKTNKSGTYGENVTFEGAEGEALMNTLSDGAEWIRFNLIRPARVTIYATVDCIADYEADGWIGESNLKTPYIIIDRADAFINGSSERKEKYTYKVYKDFPAGEVVIGYHRVLNNNARAPFITVIPN